MMLSRKSIIMLVMVVSMVIAKPTVDHCSTCQSISEFFQEMQQNQTESIINTNLYKMCLKENDGSNSRTCTFLATIAQNTLKHIVNACPSKKPIERPVSVNKNRCDFCTELVDSIKSLLTEYNADTLKSTLNQYCELTGDFEDECKQNLDKNLANFIDFVQNKMDSELFCNAVKSCHHQAIEEMGSPTIGDLVSLRDPVQMAGHLESIQKNNAQSTKIALASSKPVLKNPLTCMVCRKVVVIIYSQLKKNATREDVEHMLAKACLAIHPKDKEKQKDCESKVAKNAEKIMQSFINNVPPEIVCLLTGWCLPGAELEPIKPIARIEDLEVEDKSLVEGPVHWAQSAKCFFCEKVVGYLFDILNENKTRQYIEHLLEGSCNKLFKKEERQSKCQEYVDAYTGKLIDLIERADNPGLICNTLHMCPANNTLINQWDSKKLNKVVSSVAVNKFTFRDGPVFKIDWCNVCHKTYPILADIVEINEAKDRLTIVAHNFCEMQILPINVENCKTKVNEYMNVIVHVKDSNEGCKKLTLCPSTVNEVSFELNALKVIDLGSVESATDAEITKFGLVDDTICAACKLMIKGVYADLNKIIHNPSTKDFISRACEHIHQDELKEKCKVDTMKALETLIKDFEHNLPPQQACELMKYCRQKTEVDYSQIQNPLRDSSMCNGCKALFPVLHQILQNQEVREGLTKLNEKICDHSVNPDSCKETMNGLIDNLADEETADAGCSKLCGEDFMSTLGFPFSKCTRCQVSIIAVDHLFNSEMFKNKLNSTLEKICESGRGQFAVQCKHLFRSNVPKLYELVHNLTDHDNGFCMTIGYCEKKNEYIEILSLSKLTDDLLDEAEELIPDVNELISNENEVSDDEADSRVCDACKKVMKKVNDDVINKKNVKDELLNLLLKSCPKKDDKCRIFYKKYVNYFYSQLVRNTEPNRACQCIKLCPNDQSLYEDESDWEPEIDLTEDTACEECESAVTYLITTLNNKTVINFIVKEMIDKICKPLNFIERKTCTRFVKMFGPRMIQKFVSKINKDKICTQHLKLCKKKDALDSMSSIDFVSLLTGSRACQTCKNAVTKLNQLRGESSKRFSVEEICGQNDSECSDFMFDFKDFLQAETTNSDPTIACTDLDICLVPGRVQLLGSEEKCALGRSYWCMSAAHADACKKTQFCQQTTWETVAN